MNTSQSTPVNFPCSKCAFLDLKKCLSTCAKFFHEHINLVPQQEPTVQVPATAPAAGHLSTESVDK